jgi:hypothetical protein
VFARGLRFVEVEKKNFKNLKFGGGVEGAITTNMGLVHLNKKPQKGLEIRGKG